MWCCSGHLSNEAKKSKFGWQSGPLSGHWKMRCRNRSDHLVSENASEEGDHPRIGKLGLLEMNEMSGLLRAFE